jgi:hypothetical protein
LARYYFQFRDGDRVIDDPEGTECRDIAHARLEALAAAREIVGAAIRFGQDVPGDTIVVTDGTTKPLLVVPLAEVLPAKLKA